MASISQTSVLAAPELDRGPSRDSSIEKSKIRSKVSKAKARVSQKPGDENGAFRRSLREDDLGHLHDPEYAPFRHANNAGRPAASRTSSFSSIEATGDDLNTSRSYYGRSMQLPGLPNGVTTGVMASSASTRRQSRYSNGPTSSYAASARPTSSYLAPEQETLYPGAIAGDSSYNPYTYTFSHKRYEPRMSSTFRDSPRHPVRGSALAHEVADGGSSVRSPSRRSGLEVPAPSAANPSIAESETSELLFESEYIPTLNQPSRHRQRTVPGTTRSQEDAFEAGCYKVKRAFQSAKLDVRFAVVRLKRKMR